MTSGGSRAQTRRKSRMELWVGGWYSGHPLKLNIIRQEPVNLWKEHACCAHRLIDLMRELSMFCDFFAQNGKYSQLNFTFSGKKQGTPAFDSILRS